MVSVPGVFITLGPEGRGSKPHGIYFAIRKLQTETL